MFEVVGYEIKEGVKRSTGRPYKLEILHCMGSALPDSSESFGRSVECVVFNLLYGNREPKFPVIGDKIRVFYGRTGYPEDYVIL